ncbi:hypothetical protein [Thalassotalea crassostreae]|uniref:hypothetical protein n=1 Tax=Thalassotalea crassostreae TaxID=1763536 RepID=UPI0008395EA4|nr:hypothetical protein [Thalassotalea crassostreae]
MPRKPRLYIANMPHLIQVCGNNLQSCFYCSNDFNTYITILNASINKTKIALHAFVLLDNRITLLLTPSDEDSIGRLMQVVSSSYVKYFNRRYQRTGSLFQGRHKSSVIEPKQFLLSAMHYIEYAPIVSGICHQLIDYPWSSYGQNAQHQINDLCLDVSPHPIYLMLADDKLNRKNCYQSISTLIDSKTLSDFITERLSHNFPIGDSQFLRSLALNHNFYFTKMKPGRPRKQAIYQGGLGSENGPKCGSEQRSSNGSKQSIELGNRQRVPIIVHEPNNNDLSPEKGNVKGTVKITSKVFDYTVI